MTQLTGHWHHFRESSDMRRLKHLALEKRFWSYVILVELLTVIGLVFWKRVTGSVGLLMIKKIILCICLQAPNEVVAGNKNSPDQVHKLFEGCEVCT